MGYTELQLQHQRELAEARERIKQRKARTRRLIMIGNMMEQLVPGAAEMTPEEFQEALRKMSSPSGRRNLEDSK